MLGVPHFPLWIYPQSINASMHSIWSLYLVLGKLSQNRGGVYSSLTHHDGAVIRWSWINGSSKFGDSAQDTFNQSDSNCWEFYGLLSGPLGTLVFFTKCASQKVNADAFYGKSKDCVRYSLIQFIWLNGKCLFLNLVLTRFYTVG